MQSNQRIVSCSKQVRMDGQALLINQAIPLAGGAPEKGSPQRNCRQPADCESKGVALTKAPDGQVDRETAGKQTNGVKNRCVKNFFRRRSRQTLSQIEEVRYNEDHEIADSAAIRPNIPTRARSGNSHVMVALSIILAALFVIVSAVVIDSMARISLLVRRYARTVQDLWRLDRSYRDKPSNTAWRD